MTIPWERNFERALISFFTLPSGFQVTGFHCDSGLLVFRATSELGRRVWGLGNLKCHALLFLPRYGCFSWLYAPQIAKKPLVNFRSFEKVDHNNFCKCLNWFHGREFFFFFKWLLFCHFANVSWDDFKMLKPALHLWIMPIWLFVVCCSFYMFLDSVWKYLVEYFRIYVHEEFWFVTFLHCLCLALVSG